MRAGRSTFWDIERQRTWRIYILFGVLTLFYFVTVFIVALAFKAAIFFRDSLHTPHMRFQAITPDLLYVAIVAVVAAMIHWYYSNRNVVSKVLALMRAQHPDRRDRYHNVYNNVVDEISAAAGGVQVERYVLPTGSLNAFALADLQGRKVVGITEGLLSRAGRDELQAVVAHEIAHIVSNDCLETTITCSLFGMYGEALAGLTTVMNARQRDDLPHFGRETSKDALTLGIMTIPIFILLFVTDLTSQLLNMFISREKEYRADAATVRLTRDPVGLATVLYRIGTHWRGAGSAGDHLRPIFILNPQHSKLDEEEGLIATLFSTHPPLARRLQVILQLANADLDAIADRISSRRRTRRGQEMPDPGTRFMAQRGGRWHGPFTLPQLQTLEWLAPETPLQIAGRPETFAARELPALSHFFAKMEDPVWRVRRMCPVCREWLVPQEYEGLHVLRCAYCGGNLAQTGKLPRIFVRKERGFTDRVQRTASVIRKESKLKHPHFNIAIPSAGARHCPKCGKAMKHKFYSYAYHVEIDECPECGVMWFDADELELLQCLIEMETD